MESKRYIIAEILIAVGFSIAIHWIPMSMQARYFLWIGALVLMIYSAITKALKK